MTHLPAEWETFQTASEGGEQYPGDVPATTDQATQLELAPNTPAMTDWQSLANKGEVDGGVISVSSKEFINADDKKNSTHAKRATHVAHTALAKFAEAFHVDPQLIPLAENLQSQYFDAAKYMTSHHTNIDVEIVEEMIDEGLAPFFSATPLPIAEHIAKVLYFDDEARIGAMMVKLWAADTYELDLPSTYGKIRAIKPINRAGALDRWS